MKNEDYFEEIYHINSQTKFYTQTYVCVCMYIYIIYIYIIHKQNLNFVKEST